jgi:bifunctional DNA-binding transcriptional regulator/antitoxin component of YhaV-PrlF toxin-antitoxin module
MSKVSSRNQVTLPVEAMRQAGLRPGDEVTVRPVGDGEAADLQGTDLLAPASAYSEALVSFARLDA